jgi:hypothetical protein
VQISSSTAASIDAQPQSKTEPGNGFADVLKTVADRSNVRVEARSARPPRRPAGPKTPSPKPPPKPEGGPTLPPRCGTPPPPKPVCDLPPPKPAPLPRSDDPRYLGPPIPVNEPPICIVPPRPEPMPLPKPIDGGIERPPIMWPREPIQTFAAGGGGIGARGPFPIEDPAPMPADVM